MICPIMMVYHHYCYPFWTVLSVLIVPQFWRSAFLWFLASSGLSSLVIIRFICGFRGPSKAISLFLTGSHSRKPAFMTVWTGIIVSWLVGGFAALQGVWLLRVVTFSGRVSSCACLWFWLASRLLVYQWFVSFIFPYRRVPWFWFISNFIATVLAKCFSFRCCFFRPCRSCTIWVVLRVY